MARRIPSRLAAVALTVALSGCTDAELGAFVASLGESPAPAVPGAPGVPATVTPAGAAPGGRAERDRPDEKTGGQIHAFYVLPADAADRQLDTNGTIAGWIQEGATWLKTASGGHQLRYDTAGGQLDITVFRSKHTEAVLKARGKDLLHSLDDEVRQAGHNDPLKVNLYYYEGAHVDGKAGHGGGMAAIVYLPTSTVTQWTTVHELFHALGAVPECAPNRATDAHVTDNPLDLMAPARERGTPILDFGQNDYFGHGRPGCMDMAKSPFLEPMPAGAVPAVGLPVATTVDASAVAYQPAWPVGGAPGDPGMEGAAQAVINQIRQDAGLAPLSVDPRLQEAARRHAAAAGSTDGIEAARLAGYAGFAGGTTITMTLRPTDDVISRIEAYMATYRSNFSQIYTKAGLTDMGLGGSLEGTQLKLTFYSGRNGFDVEGVKLGATPMNTRTVVGRVKMRAGQGYDRLRVAVDGEFNQNTYW
ncbi:MAG: CAP domain-containing protein, partial [Candidatus Sericytochromatia bacterium]